MESIERVFFIIDGIGKTSVGDFLIIKEGEKIQDAIDRTRRKLTENFVSALIKRTIQLEGKRIDKQGKDVLDAHFVVQMGTIILLEIVFAKKEDIVKIDFVFILTMVHQRLDVPIGIFAMEFNQCIPAIE